MSEPKELAVLIVDDDPDRPTRLIHRLQTLEGLQTTVKSPLAAMNRPFDLALVFHPLKYADGLEVIGRLAQGKGGFTPVLGVIEGVESGAPLSLFAQGAVDYLRVEALESMAAERVEYWTRMRRRWLAAGDPPWPGEDHPPWKEYRRQARILVLDDQAVQLMFMGKFLHHEGFEQVTTLSDPQALLDRLEQGERFDAVITDYHLPGTNGLELAARLLTPEGNDPHLILITADQDATLRQQAHQAGVGDFLVKPLDRNELVWRLKRGLRMRFALTGPGSRAAGPRGESP
ncbi:MAG: response regulator [Magnetococcales bacterium]|nr:response regulator [Magnetococcales bacterium]